MPVPASLRSIAGIEADLLAQCSAHVSGSTGEPQLSARSRLKRNQRTTALLAEVAAEMAGQVEDRSMLTKVELPRQNALTVKPFSESIKQFEEFLSGKLNELQLSIIAEYKQLPGSAYPLAVSKGATAEQQGGNTQAKEEPGSHVAKAVSSSQEVCVVDDWLPDPGPFEEQITDSPANASRKQGSSLLTDSQGTAPKSACAVMGQNKTRSHTPQQPVVEVVHQAKQNVFKRLVLSQRFDLCVSGLIMLYSMFLAVQYQWQGDRAAVLLGLYQEEGQWRNAEPWFSAVEHIFNAMFLAEVILRICALRSRVFMQGWNIFDATMVLFSSLDMYVLSQLGDRGPSMNTFRMLRVFKAVRVLRMARLMEYCASLRLLMTTIYSSLGALVWSMSLLGLFMLITGIFMCQMTHDFIVDETQELAMREWVWKYYGSAARSTYTMFEITLSGCWPNYARPLIEGVSHWYAWFFIAYVAGVVFGVIRIITAIFLKETLKAASQDAEMCAAQQTNSTIRKFFYQTDESGDGLINLQEFEVMIEQPKVKAWLKFLDLDAYEAETLFYLLDDGRAGGISYEDFIHGIMRLKGQSRSIDIAAIQHDTEAILTLLAQVCMTPGRKPPLEVNGET